MNEKSINTKVLPGFMELLPAEQIVFDGMIATIRKVYELYGFVPIDTPVIERAEVLLAKAGGETEKQIYRFTKGENDLALRFDLTVPLARYVSEHVNELVFPFRRYHIGKVYRGESPQKGRFREFYQCDIDVIGNGALSLMNDAEIPCVIYDVFRRLNFGAFMVCISNRKLITGLLSSLGAEESAVDVMRAIDKVEKVGEQEVRKLLTEIGITNKAIASIFGFLAIKGSSAEIISQLRGLNVANEVFQAGISELDEVIGCLGILGMPQEFYSIDLSIARGLDYYTGTVYETTLTNHPEIGSICSGGRYDNLAEKYTNNKLPGVGISIGLTRLFSQLQSAGILKIGPATQTRVLVVSFLEDMSVALELASLLRSQDIPTEVHFENVKIKARLTYANKLGIPYVVFVGEDEISSGQFTVKEMATGSQIKVSKGELAQNLRKEVRDEKSALNHS